MSAPAASRPTARRWIGIDFSGNHLQWRDSRAATAVWIAQIEQARRGPALCDVRRVQDLPGDEPPFRRLVHFLRSSDFAVAGIDAPFSPPAAYVPGGSRERLLAAIGKLTEPERPFATGTQLVGLLAPALAPRGRHVHRLTEQIWRRRGINVRSVLWNGPRGGAPFAAACMTLQAELGLPAWPWDEGSERILAEAFPAAQLRTWDLPYYGYNGTTAAARGRRRRIIDGLAARAGLAIPDALRRTLKDSADALDSVVCALAARALTANALAVPPSEASSIEGWIVVHR